MCIRDSVDSQYGYCSFASTNEAETPALCCIEDISLSDTSTPEVELPQHLQVLFLQTVESSELSQPAEDGLKQLLLDHQNTFAKSKTDIGLCNVVQHDIDTGDTRPIKQSPRRPPLNSGTAEVTLYRKCCLLVLYNHQTQHGRPLFVLSEKKTIRIDSVLTIVN